MQANKLGYSVLVQPVLQSPEISVSLQSTAELWPTGQPAETTHSMSGDETKGSLQRDMTLTDTGGPPAPPAEPVFASWLQDARLPSPADRLCLQA